MKGIKTILGALAVAGLLLSFNASAQENNNRDAEGNVVRGPYETNGTWDNVFVGGGLGWNAGIWGLGTKPANPTFLTYIKDYPLNLQGYGGPALDLYVGKWFTPAVGLRAGYRGIMNFVGKVDFTKIDWQHYVHADVLWNISNTIGGYKETRKWDVIPYFTMGLMDVKRHNGNYKYFWGDVEYAAGLGLLNEIYLNERLNLNVDFMLLATHEKQWGGKHAFFFPASATVGVSYTLGKPNFDRHSSIAPTVIPVPFTVEEYNALEAKVKALEKENAELKNKVAALEKELAPFKNLVDGEEYVYRNGKFTTAEDAGIATVSTPAAVYFDLGSAKLSERELAHLEYFAQNVNKDSKLEIVGSADKQTGSHAVNQKISQQRADYVKNLLVNKYGFNASNIEVHAVGDTMQQFNTPAKNRCCTIKVK